MHSPLALATAPLGPAAEPRGLAASSWRHPHRLGLSSASPWASLAPATCTSVLPEGASTRRSPWSSRFGPAALGLAEAPATRNRVPWPSRRHTSCPAGRPNSIPRAARTNLQWLSSRARAPRALRPPLPPGKLRSAGSLAPRRPLPLPPPRPQTPLCLPPVPPLLPLRGPARRCQTYQVEPFLNASTCWALEPADRRCRERCSSLARQGPGRANPRPGNTGSPRNLLAMPVPAARASRTPRTQLVLFALWTSSQRTLAAPT
mmetsp:Transcript_87962/g.247145  ORF Transcript_87962/g.247145 Transcript_87962/m.247145 type:complete len:261 (+) Transcript_87962:708-1490(+)